MKKLISVLLLTLAAFTTTYGQTFIDYGLKYPTTTDADSSVRELRRKYDPINPRNSGIWAIREGKDSLQLSMTPAGIKLIERDSNTVLRAAIRAKLDTSATITASKIGSGTLVVGRIPQLPITKITDLTGTLASKADLVEGKVPLSQLSAVVISDVFVVNTQVAMLSLSAERGDIAIRSDLNKTFVLSTDSPATLADWKELPTPTAAVSSVAGKTGAVSLEGADITSGTVPIARLPVATSGTSTSISVVRADDARLSDPRTPTTHVHAGTDITTGTVPLARLPVVATGVNSATGVVRGDDARLSDPRTPTTHNHSGADITSGTVPIARLPATTTGTLSATSTTTVPSEKLVKDAIDVAVSGFSSVPPPIDYLVNGIAISSIPLMSVETNKSLTSGTGYSYRVTAPVSATVTRVIFEVTTAAGTLSGGSAGNSIAVYNTSGTQLAWADCSSGGAFTSTGTKSVNLASSLAITSGTEYIFVIVCSASSNASVSASNGITMINAGISSAPYRHQSKTSFTQTNGGSITPGSSWSATISQIVFLGFAQ
jgi:hypothetical protein